MSAPSVIEVAFERVGESGLGDKAADFAAQASAPSILNGDGFVTWATTELHWLAVQALRVSFSVTVFRFVSAVMGSEIFDAKVYEKARDFGASGRQRPKGYATPNQGRSPFSGPEQPADAKEGESKTTQDGSPRLLADVFGYKLYLNSRILDPETQYWPCPLLYQSPCESCVFFARDRKGNKHCAGRWKAKYIAEGRDDGESLQEIKQWVKEMD